MTLFASGDSLTRARLVPVIPRATRLRRPRPDASVVATLLLEAMTEAADEFDVIHFHIDWIHLPLMHRLSTPFLKTCHGRLDLPGLSQVIQKFPSAPFISVSDSQRAPLKHGITGFIVENQVGAVKAVRDLGFIDRRRVRGTFEQRFTCERMTRSYLAHYQDLVSGTAQRTVSPISVGELREQDGIGTTDPRGRRLLPRID